MKKVFEIEEGNTLIQTAWLSGAKYEKGSGEVTLTFSSYLKPYMLKLNQLYTQYKLSNVLLMKSKYSPKIYEILKSNEFKKQKFIEIEVDRLRKMFKAEDIYPLYADFKRHVIQKTQKELKKYTDIAFDFEEIKTGRKVTSIKFIIKANEPTYNKPVGVLPRYESKNTSETENPLESKLEPLRAIMDKSITNLEIKKIYDAGKGNLEKIIKIYYYAKDKEVDNLVGYMIKLLKDGYNEPKKNVPKSKKDFTERDYDYDDLERKLLGWDK
jgi:plasmid replication initiation protein